MKNNVYTRAAAFAAVSLALAGSLSASPLVLGDAGVDLGLVDTGVIYNALTIPVNSIYGNTWITPLSGFATYVAPVSQFTGINDDGSLVAPGDLIPLRSTSITIVDPAGIAPDLVIDSNFSGGAGPAGPTGPAFSEIVQLTSNGPQTAYTGTQINFGQQTLALASPNNLYSNTADTITLQPNHTYKLTFVVPVSNGDLNDYTVFRFFNLTTGTYFGPFAQVVGLTLYNYTLIAFITPTVPTTLAVKVDYQYGEMVFGGNSGINPYLTVESVR